MSVCRICSGPLVEFICFGDQPLSDRFLSPGGTDEEFVYRLAVGCCASCTMVQLIEEIPREQMFNHEYPYLSSGSTRMQTHFTAVAKDFLAAELSGPDPFIVELGCNDGVMLKTIADSGIRHLGIDPSSGVADLAAAKGIQVRKEFFEESTALEVLSANGKADVIYGANTLCHIPYMASVLRGVKALLAPNGVFVFEDPYFADIVRQTSFDQIYDEHFYYFTARSVQALAAQYDLELVDVTRLSVHGGEVRYTLAREGARRPSPAVADIISEETAAALTSVRTLERLSSRILETQEKLVSLLCRLNKSGKVVAGYGATAKSATVLNYCGIGPDLIAFISDSTPAKQGRLTPGSHIPVVPPETFTKTRPDYAVLFAWNHAAEIIAKEQDFYAAGGRWIRYVPEVHIV